MNPDSATSLITLVERLRSDTPVEWGEVEALVAGAPAWRELVELLYERAIRNTALGLSVPTRPSYLVPLMMRERLLGIFAPYAILLDSRHTPAERAVRLEKESGADVRRFCQGCLHDHDPTIVEAAQAVLEAWQTEKTLVRGAGAPEVPPEELLRVASSGPSREDALLHPADASAVPDTEPPKSHWLRRLFGR